MPASDNNSALATDENRDLEIKSPFQDDLLISHAAGAERLSQPFHFDLSLESAKGDLKSDTILGQPVNVKFLVDSDDKPHYFHGIVTDFGHTGYDGRFHQYHAILRPWFWLLTRSADCRIFEDMLQRFNPQALKTQFDSKPGRKGGLGFGGQGRYWDAFEEYYRDVTADPSDCFRRLFGDQFARAYEEQIQRLRSTRQSKG